MKRLLVTLFLLFSLASSASAQYRGDIDLGDTIDWKFTTTDTSGVPTTLAGSPVVSCYVDNGTTEITAGITLTVDFDSRTGMHNVRVVATSGNGYATGTNVECAITTGTVGGSSVVGYVVGSFSIDKRSALRPATAGRTLVVSSGGAADADAVAISTDATAANNLETMLDGTGGATLSLGKLNIVNSAGDAVVASSTGSNGNGVNITGNGVGRGMRITGGASAEGLFVESGASDGSGAVFQSHSAGDYAIHAFGDAGANGVGFFGGDASGSTAAGHAFILTGGTASTTSGGTSGRAINATGGAGASSTNGASPAAVLTGGGTTTVSGGDGLRLTATGSEQDLDADVVGNITGNLSGSVGSVASGGITSSSFASGAIDATAIAADAIGAAEVASSALAKGTEITGFNDLDAAGVRTAVGLASANLDTQLSTIDDYVDAEVAAIKTKTDFLPSATAGAAGGVFIAGTNAPVTITGSGNALTLTSTGGNGVGLAASGNGSGAGLLATAGATGHGASFVGGATSGDGIRAVATTEGTGLWVQGGDDGNGLYAKGGTSDGAGLLAQGGGGNAEGIWAIGSGASAAITAWGANASGSTPGGAAMSLLGGAASTTGGGTSAPALIVTGGDGAASTNGAAAGATFTAGGTTTVSGNDGVELVGSGSGFDLDANLTGTDLLTLLRGDNGPALPTATVQADGGNSTTQAKTDRSESTTDYWKDALIQFAGTCNIAGQVAKVTAYNGSTKIITWSPAKTATPDNGCSLWLINR
jgi:hypothetical protein